MSTEVILEEAKSYIVQCQYRQSGASFESHWGSKCYAFQSNKSHVPGELVVVKDKNGYSLVRVDSCSEYPHEGKSSFSPVVDLDQINAEARLAHKKEQIQTKIREAVIQDIERNAFERLAASHPELKDTLEEFKALDGSYSELMPSIKNLIGVEK